MFTKLRSACGGRAITRMAIAFSVAFGMYGVSLTGAAAAKFQWRYYSVSPSFHPYSKILQKHFDNIRERTNGDLSIDLVYFGETPYKGSEADNIMRDGLGEMTEWLLGYSTSTYPLLSGPELPFLPVEKMDPARHIKAMDQAWQSPSVAAELETILKEHNAVRLSRFYWPPQNYWLSKPVEKPADFKGLKIREYSAEGIDFTKAIGAIPVSMTAPDVYAALQRGALDGVVTASTSMEGLKWGEVLNSGYITNFKLTISLILVSQRAYDSLPPEGQKVLSEEVQSATQEILDFMAANEGKIHQMLRDKYDFKIVDAKAEDYDKLREIAKTQVWPAWIKRVGEDVGKPIINDVLETLGAPDRM